jgi:hypothetical protein
VRHLEGGVIHQHVDAAEFLHRALDDGAAVGRIGQVARHQDRLAAGFLDQALGFLRILVLVQVGDQDVRAFARERQGHGAADAAVGAGDQGRLAGQAAVADVAVFAVVGFRGEQGFAARGCLLWVSAGMWSLH